MQSLLLSFCFCTPFLAAPFVFPSTHHQIIVKYCVYLYSNCVTVFIIFLFIQTFQAQFAGLLPPSPHRMPRGQQDPDNMQVQYNLNLPLMAGNNIHHLQDKQIDFFIFWVCFEVLHGAQNLNKQFSSWRFSVMASLHSLVWHSSPAIFFFFSHWHHLLLSRYSHLLAQLWNSFMAIRGDYDLHLLLEMFWDIMGVNCKYTHCISFTVTVWFCGYSNKSLSSGAKKRYLYLYFFKIVLWLERSVQHQREH